MGKKKTLNALLLTLIIVGSLGITVAFAALYATLEIKGSAIMRPASWDIAFANLSAPQLTGDASVISAPTLSDTLIGTYSVQITKPGDSITYTFDVTNDGDLDAKIGTFTKAVAPTCVGVSLTQAEADATTVCSNLSYTLTYTVGGATVAQNDVLLASETKNMTLTLSYSGSSLPSDDVNITGLDITMVFIEN